MIGKTISHYKILEKLGSGGMGIVYKAQDLKLDRYVALKFLPSYLSTNDEEKQRFIQEAKAASALQHHNICAIHEIDETTDKQLFIVMDYFDYILRSVKTSSYYIGHTNNITDRFDRHNEGRVLSTKSDRPWELVVYYRYKSRAEAMKLEKRLKAFKNRRALETYIKNNLGF